MSPKLQHDDESRRRELERALDNGAGDTYHHTQLKDFHRMMTRSGSFRFGWSAVLRFS